MEEQNLTALLQEYDDHTIEGTKPSTSWMSTLLKELRKSNVNSINFKYIPCWPKLNVIN